MAKKFLDSDGLLYLWQKIVNTFVKKDGNKVLSDNNYTTTEKEKLAGLSNYTLPTASSSVKGGVKIGSGLEIATDGTLSAAAVAWDAVQNKPSLAPSDAEKNVQADWNVTETGSDAFIKNKPTIPTNNNQLTNGAGYQTAAQVNTAITTKGYQTATQVNEAIEAKGYLTSVPAEYVTEAELSGKGYQTATQVNSAITGKGYQTASQVQTLINNAIGGITGITFEIVTALPTTGTSGTFYLMSNSGANPNSYDEYIYYNSKWEKIGTTEITLETITNAEIDTIVSSTT